MLIFLQTCYKYLINLTLFPGLKPWSNIFCKQAQLENCMTSGICRTFYWVGANKKWRVMIFWNNDNGGFSDSTDFIINIMQERYNLFLNTWPTLRIIKLDCDLFYIFKIYFFSTAAVLFINDARLYCNSNCFLDYLHILELFWHMRLYQKYKQNTTL